MRLLYQMGMVSAVRGSTLSLTAVKHTSAAAAGGGISRLKHTSRIASRLKSQEWRLFK